MAFSAFPSPLTLEQANKLNVGDHVDHKRRGTWAGRMVLAQIVEKNGSKLKLSYLGWSFNATGEPYTISSDYSEELHRFYPAFSISKRKTHRFEENVDFKKGDFVDININNSGWQVGRIQNIYGFQFGISFKGNDNAHKTHYVHIDNAKEFNLFGTRTKKIYSEMVPLWLKTRSNAKCVTNKTAHKINNKIIKSVFGGASHLMDFIINNSNQSCLRQINEIIVKEKETIKTKKNVKSREINDSNEEDKSKRYMTRSVARAKKTAKNVTKKIKQSNKKVEKIYSFLDIQCNSLLAHICSFLLKSDLSVFKYASTAVCIVCMDELEKLDVGVLNMNTFIENVAVSNRNYLDIKEFQCLFTINRYPAYIKYKRLYQIFDDKYGIPQQYQLLIIYPDIDVDFLKNRFIAEVSKTSDERNFLLFDKRNTIMFNDENKPIVMTENVHVVKKYNHDGMRYRFIVLKWFDIFHQKIKVIQFLYVQPSKITIQTLVKYVESQFIATTNKQSDWYTRKIESYLLEMDDECVVRFPQPKLIIHGETFRGGIKLMDNMNQKCSCSNIYIAQINPNHPYWSKSKFCTLQEKYNLM